MHLIAVTNAMVSGAYTFRAVDTTLINVRWNTSPGNDIWWILLNVSDMPTAGTLTALDNNGQAIASVQFSIPPGSRVTRSSAISDINLPSSIAGSAIFSHNGPPNSILGEAFMVSTTMTTPANLSYLICGDPLTRRTSDAFRFARGADRSKFVRLQSPSSTHWSRRDERAVCRPNQVFGQKAR
jgi:hypothetical protein